MKVIIAGGRDVTSLKLIELAVELSGFEITEVVSGGADGVDYLGEMWAKRRKIPVVRFPAQWDTHGKRAGPMRNEQMAKYIDKFDGRLILIDSGGPGSKDMLRRAKNHRRPIFHVRATRTKEGHRVDGTEFSFNARQTNNRPTAIKSGR